MAERYFLRYALVLPPFNPETERSDRVAIFVMCGMRLLIITQKVDSRDDVLGFFHVWIVEFAKQYEHVTVICLQKGECDLPKNVTMLSLGKEEKRSRRAYLGLFYRYIWQERQKYDAVFVHMNPVYLALAGPLWRLWGKKVSLWYIHPNIGRYLKAAHLFADVIFTASKNSFPFSSPKVLAVGHGIDAERFKPMPDAVKEKNSILYVGRISPIKHLDLLIGAVRSLREKSIDFTLHLIGGPDARHADYYAAIKKETADLEKEGRVIYHGQIPNREMPRWYNAYEVLVNVTPSGSFDKTVLEAMACGTLVAVSNVNFAPYIPTEFLAKEGDSASLAGVLAAIFSLPGAEKERYAQELRQTVLEHHGLAALVVKIKNALS